MPRPARFAPSPWGTATHREECRRHHAILTALQKVAAALDLKITVELSAAS